MTELFPVVPGPSWLNNKTQPIAIQNVVDYLAAALTNPNGRGRIFEIGGPETAHYKDLMLRYAQIRGLRRSMVLLPYIPLWFMAFGVGLMTPVPRPIAYALIGGLSADSVVKHPEALTVFPEVKLIGFNEAARKALGYTSPFHIERVWDDGTKPVKTLKHEGSFVHHREEKVHASPEQVFDAIKSSLQQGWMMEAEDAQRIVIHVENQFAGQKWIEWRTGYASSVTHLSQTVFFAPCGLPGFLYWYLLHPLHLISFRALINAITRKSLSKIT
jgi:hypothetical protein